MASGCRPSGPGMGTAVTRNQSNAQASRARRDTIGIRGARHRSDRSAHSRSGRSRRRSTGRRRRITPALGVVPRQRMVVEASAIGDLALRTWVASLLATTVTPVVVAAALRQADSATERGNLNFYAELGAKRDPAESFPPPTELPGSRRGRPIRWRSGSRAARSTTSRFPAVSRRSTPQCASTGAR